MIATMRSGTPSYFDLVSGCYTGISTNIRALIVYAICSVGTILFTALGISVAVISLHGACRIPDDLFTDEVEVKAGPAKSLH